MGASNKARHGGSGATRENLKSCDEDMTRRIALTPIPENVMFSDLRLSRLPSGRVQFSWAVIDRVRAASNKDVKLLRDADEKHIYGLIVAWYELARSNGEPMDAATDDLIAKLRDEAAIAYDFILPPGWE